MKGIRGLIINMGGAFVLASIATLNMTEQSTDLLVIGRTFGLGFFTYLATVYGIGAGVRRVTTNV